MGLDIQLPDPPGGGYVLVHYHIFKNGGSTIVSILDREFPGRFVTLHGQADDSTVDKDRLGKFLQQNPGISAVSSHHFRYPNPIITNTIIFDCCFLRHPLDRLQSVYSYFRGIDSPDPLCRMAHDETSRDFIKKLIDDFPHYICNTQVNLLANRGALLRPADETDLQRASGFLREMAIPGLVEWFDESLVAAEYFLKAAFPKLQLDYVPENVSRPQEGSIEERLERLRDSWGEDVYETLTRLNQFDLELFCRAEREIQRRFSLVPDKERRMEEFKARCARRLAPVDADAPVNADMDALAAP